jgi:hypothetical protein
MEDGTGIFATCQDPGVIYAPRYPGRSISSDGSLAGALAVLLRLGERNGRGDGHERYPPGENGLGMIAKPLMEDTTLGVGELLFSRINF